MYRKIQRKKEGEVGKSGRGRGRHREEAMGEGVEERNVKM